MSEQKQQNDRRSTPKRTPNPRGSKQHSLAPSSIGHIQAIVATKYGISPDEIRCNRRDARLVLPRHIAMYLAREITGRSFPEIGRAFGGRHHTSVMHGVNRIAACLAIDPEFAAEITALRERAMQQIAA